MHENLRLTICFHLDRLEVEESAHTGSYTHPSLKARLQVLRYVLREEQSTYTARMLQDLVYVSAEPLQMFATYVSMSGVKVKGAWLAIHKSRFN